MNHRSTIMNSFSKIKSFIPRLVKLKLKRAFYNIYDSPRYYISRKKPPKKAELSHVVFICKGNICRSAYAEYYLKAKCSASSTVIESCGLDVDQGNFSPPFAIKAAAEYDLFMERHRSKGLAECDLQHSDLIVLMEYQQLLRFNMLYPQLSGKTVLLREFSPWPDHLFCNIYDPFGQRFEEFQKCFRLMAKALNQLAYYTTR